MDNDYDVQYCGKHSLKTGYRSETNFLLITFEGGNRSLKSRVRSTLASSICRRWRRGQNRDTVPAIFKFNFATGSFSEQGHLHLSNTYTSLGFPSGPVSTLGGTRKVVKRNIWGGMYKFIMSARVDGLYNNLWWVCREWIMCLSIWLAFSFPDRISSDV